MRILYLIAFEGIAGGHKVIFEQVNRLIDRGHEVIVLSLLKDTHPTWFPLKTKVLYFDGKVPEVDIMVATSSATAIVADRIKKGIPFYFIQGYEVSFSDTPNYIIQCEDSYRLPLNILVHSNWLKDLFKDKYNRQSHLMSIGIDLDHFRPIDMDQLRNKKILMIYSSHPIKGSRIGLEAFRLIKSGYPDVELVMFGLEPPPKLDFSFAYFQNPSQTEIPRLYSSCSIFILPSTMEGLSLPPLEAMACKRAVVVTDCLGTREYARDGKTALVVPPRNPERLSEAVIRLLEDDQLRRRLAENGHKEARRFSWYKAINQLEKIFNKAHREYLKNLQGRSQWEKVIAISPDDVWAHYCYGLELYGQRDLEGAQREFGEAIRLNPNFPLAYKELGKLLLAKGDQNGALVNLKKAHELLLSKSPPT